MTDYTKIIDAETWSFIAQTQSHYPDDTAAMSIADQRRHYDALCRAFSRGYPDNVTAFDSVADTVPYRHYSTSKSDTLVIYFHGGGYVVGGLESHDDICAEICSTTGFDVCSVDYRLAPEHKHPAMFDDAMTAVRHLLDQTDGPVLLCGDSAGGNLGAAAAHALRGETTRIAGQVLIYPTLGGDINTGSYITHANAPMLTRSDMLFYSKVRLDEAHVQDGESDAHLYPLADDDFSGLPPTVIVTAECDPLSDDGRDYRDAIIASRGNAVWFNEAGLVHGYLRARSSVRRAKDSFDRITAALNALGKGEWPYS
ncbi:MAG: alpha/beta hydrolase fold domain-containing protein [Bacteroidetes bacterium]|nr:alpha/beta hydrolase fold domain-containing protein [Bacteroidota bacterium]